MKNNRMNTLNQNGIDTSRFFTLTANYDIPKGSTIDIQVNPVAEQIIKNGYVKNSKLHRRWITAQYLRMMNSPSGWYAYLKYHYAYMYQFKMMIEEVRVLSILLDSKDMDTFVERSKFFTIAKIKEILHRYYEDVEQYLHDLRVHNRRNGDPYIKVARIGNVNVSDIDSLLETIRALIGIIDAQFNYKDIYETLRVLEKKLIHLPDRHAKIKTWVDTFQYEGAYYTLMNLVKFHGCALKENINYRRCRELKGIEAVNYLKSGSLVNEGYIWHALLKETIEYNNFDLATSINKGE